MQRHAAVALALATATLLALPLAARAQATPVPSFSLTLAGGQSHTSLDCTGATTCSTGGFATKLVAGVNVNDGLTAELVYARLGSAKIGVPGVSATVKASFVGLGLAGHYDVNPNWAAVIRGGLAMGSTTDTETVAGIGSIQENRSGTNHWYAGLGGRAYLTRHWRVDVDWDWTRVAARIGGEKTTRDASALMVGGTYTF